MVVNGEKRRHCAALRLFYLNCRSGRARRCFYSPSFYHTSIYFGDGIYPISVRGIGAGGSAIELHSSLVLYCVQLSTVPSRSPDIYWTVSFPLHVRAIIQYAFYHTAETKTFGYGSKAGGAGNPFPAAPSFYCCIIWCCTSTIVAYHIVPFAWSDQTIPFLARQPFLVPVTCNPCRYLNSPFIRCYFSCQPHCLPISTNPYLHTNKTKPHTQ